MLNRLPRPQTRFRDQVIEAALRSGSLITARFALERGREVFAVPGSPLDPRCRGTNNLIREGATLVESAADVLQVLDGMIRVALPAPEPFALAEEAEPSADAEDVIAAARAEVLGQLGPRPPPSTISSARPACRPGCCAWCSWSWSSPAGWSATPATGWR